MMTYLQKVEFGRTSWEWGGAYMGKREVSRRKGMGNREGKKQFPKAGGRGNIPAPKRKNLQVRGNSTLMSEENTSAPDPGGERKGGDRQTYKK